MQRGSLLLACAIGAASAPGLLLVACGPRSTASPAPATATSDVGSGPAPSSAKTDDKPGDTAPAPHKKTMADCAAQSGSTVDVPTSDAGMMNNGQPDAGSADRSGDDIRTIVQANRDKFRCCYDVALADHPGLEGSFVVGFTLAPNGSLKTAALDKTASDIKDDAMGDCAVAILKTLTFPPSRKGKESTVSYPFGFHPKGGKR
jgi:hypothetical protein